MSWHRRENFLIDFGGQSWEKKDLSDLRNRISRPIKIFGKQYIPQMSKKCKIASLKSAVQKIFSLKMDQN